MKFVYAYFYTTLTEECQSKWRTLQKSLRITNSRVGKRDISSQFPVLYSNFKWMNFQEKHVIPFSDILSILCSPNFVLSYVIYIALTDVGVMNTTETCFRIRLPNCIRVIGCWCSNEVELWQLHVFGNCHLSCWVPLVDDILRCVSDWKKSRISLNRICKPSLEWFSRSTGWSRIGAW